MGPRSRISPPTSVVGMVLFLSFICLFGVFRENKFLVLTTSSSVLCTDDPAGPGGTTGAPTTSQEETRSSSTRAPTNEIQCTPELLTSPPNKSTPNGWWEVNETTASGNLTWKVSPEVQQACRLTQPYIHPLSSKPRDIQRILNGKWILIMGDSSARMLHDYWVGRWLGNYTHWPDHLTSHGPPEHSQSCYHDLSCSYDVMWKGARITFVWTALHVTKELHQLVHRTVGRPDVVIGQQGFWNVRLNTSADAQEHSRSVVTNITKTISHEEMEEVYPRVYEEKKPFMIWMSSFAKAYFRLHFNDSDNQPYDGSYRAKNLGWNFFDRTYFGKLPESPPEGPHPMNVVLEVELEMLLLIISNLPDGGDD